MSVTTFRAAIGLGANLGPAQQTLLTAVEAMGRLPWTSVRAVSSFYCTAPVGTDGPDYINAVALIDTGLGPLELLHALQGLELTHGRVRPFLHAPRTLDLDILWLDTLCRQSRELTIPHPRWQERAFVLEPLAEVLAVAPEGQDLWGWPLPEPVVRARLAAEQGIERIIS